MERICAWCKKFMGNKEPLDDPSITRGMCEECERELSGSLENKGNGGDHVEHRSIRPTSG